ncbi:MAG: hypothetical protein C0426_13990 [Rhodobacter sp.]|nr:hypothetical protein [Rhodobacter sp.]MBS3980655.1 hypothetical protein [Paracoccaceae bacterium]
MDLDALRRKIAERLATGLQTEVWPRAGTGEEVNAIVTRLRVEAGDDLDRKLVIAGFTDHTVVAEDMPQPCETCMYYKVHARFCDLPELMLPVEPHWSCRLWRI